MIKIKSSLGTATINNYDIKTDSEIIEAAFNLIKDDIIFPQDGPIEYALVQNLTEIITDIETVKYIPEPLEKEIDY